MIPYHRQTGLKYESHVTANLVIPEGTDAAIAHFRTQGSNTLYQFTCYE